MTEIKKYTKDVLFETIRKISDQVSNPIKAYLIGGLAMGSYGLKESTKDVDLFFPDRESSMIFINAIRKVGYSRKIKLDNIYQEMGTEGIFTKENGQNYDIFVEQVCKGIFLTDGMRNRANDLMSRGNLELLAISPEDIFLFKTITPRPGDLDDMFILIQRDLNWDIILDEIHQQPDHFHWIGDFYNRTGELEQKYGVKVPIRKLIEEESELSILICSILEILGSREMVIDELYSLVDENDRAMIDRAIEILLDMGRVELDGKALSRVNNDIILK